MNPNSNLREILISKKKLNEKNENNKINKQINKNNNNEKKIEFSKSLCFQLIIQIL